MIPCFRYRNAPAAIEWLCATFGFEKHLVVPNDDGTVAHVQLSFGNGDDHVPKARTRCRFRDPPDDYPVSASKELKPATRRTR
jgi:uncharacterized glyoxalase superfamily protein PhnB